MAKKRPNHQPSFLFDTEVEFVIHGQGFVGDKDGFVTVELSNNNGYTWKPKKAKGKVINPQHVRVRSTPGKGKGPLSGPSGGVGDLTTTVTNGDGSGKSSMYTEDVYYG